MKDIFRGSLVRLSADPSEVLARAEVRWGRDSEYIRLADDSPNVMWSEKKRKEWVEKDMEKDPVQTYSFSIHTLADDVLIGGAGLHPVWEHADGWLGIVIGERDYWNRGYGTDAMRLLVGYGFYELNLHRISLSLHSYNERARRVYEKIGFIYEGTRRGDMHRDGRRTDGIYMGILRREWLAREGGDT